MLSQGVRRAVAEKARGAREFFAGEADDDDVDVGLVGGFAVPDEGRPGEVDFVAAVEELFPEDADGYALANGVRGDEGGAGGGAFHEVGGFAEPTGDVVDFVGLGGAEDKAHVFFLGRAPHVVADEGRVAHDVVEGARGEGGPVEAEGVAFGDAVVGFEGEEVEGEAHDLGGFGQHLGFGDPEGGLGDGYGEVVDFDAVELPDADADGVVDDAEYALPLVAGGDGAVFEAAEGEVGFGQEVAGAAGGVEEGQGGEFLLVGEEGGVALAGDGEGEGGVEFGAQGVEEERVDDFGDVLDGGVVHAAAAAGLGVERALEDGAEDGRGDVRPVEVLGGVLEEGVLECRGELRDFDGAREEGAVDVGERGEGGLEIGGAAGGGRVQDLEQFEEGVADVFGRQGREEVVELVVGKDARVLGVEAEDEADAQDVQPVEDFRGGVAVLGEKGVVDAADDAARLDGDFHLARDAVAGGVDQEAEAVEFVGEVGQADGLGLGVRVLHVVDVEFGEVARDDPAGALGVGQRGGVAAGLLEGRQERAVGLLDRRAEVAA